MLKISTADYTECGELGYIKGIRYNYDPMLKKSVYKYDISIRVTPFEIITTTYDKNTGLNKSKTWQVNHDKSGEWSYKVNKRSITTCESVYDLTTFFGDSFWDAFTEKMFDKMDKIL